jgi:hypothetical protein
MQSDIKYQGIYRGVVVATNDPENLGRVTLRVPQVFGTEVTNWAWPIIGVPESRKIPYGSWISTATQTTADNTVNNIIALNTNEGSYGIDLINPSTTTPATSAIKFSQSGIYNIQISSQLYTTIGGNSFLNVDMWMRQNGTDVPNSVGSVSIGAKNPYAISSWNYIIDISAGDTLQWVWHVNTSISTSLLAIAAQVGPPAQPETPSFTVSATQVSGNIPIAGSSVWVMFEGGDPDFPLWLGTF